VAEAGGRTLEVRIGFGYGKGFREELKNSV